MEIGGRLPLAELKRLERAEKDASRARRLRIVILACEGWTAPAIAMAVGLSRRICQRWAQRYNEHGLAGLDDLRGRAPRGPLTSAQQVAMRERIEAGATNDDAVCSLRGRDFQRILAEEFGVLRSLAAIATEHPDQQLRIYFQDESRFGQQGTTTNVWAKRGSRPTAIRQTEYEYLWVLGAVCPETGYAEGLLSPRLNTQIVNIFLEQFSRTIPADEHAVMIWDGAGFHTSKQLRVPPNVSLVQLPAYSPELNPIENLWHYLKSHFWSNRTYADYEALETAAMQAWQTAVLDAKLMKTVCAATQQKRASSA